MNHNDIIKDIIIKALSDEALSADEQALLTNWLTNDDNRRLFDDFRNEEFLKKKFSQIRRIDIEEHKMALREKIYNKPKVISFSNRGWYRYVAAAVVLMAALTGFWLYSRPKPTAASQPTIAKVTDDVAPGKTKAVLTLADGRSIELDSGTTGQLALQGETSVMNKNGELVYSASDEGHKNEVLWNTVSTAKGQTYPLLLSDNSKVWLNSESSISFPVSFTGDLREVKITGEVFFQVAHNANKPFRVTANDMTVQVLGTTFDVNAYPDEDAVRTTLVEGSVQVEKGIQKKIIKPGQQAQVLPNDIKVEDVDLDKITAWQKGLFWFKDDKLSEVIKNIARWYNVDVKFEGNAANVDVSGTIPRKANLSQLVKLLDAIDVDARIEGRELILKAQ